MSTPYPTHGITPWDVPLKAYLDDQFSTAQNIVSGDLTLNSDSGAVGSGDIIFKTGSTEQMRVTGNGSGIVLNGPVNTDLMRMFPTFRNATSQFNGIYIKPVARGNIGAPSGQGLYGLTIDARDDTAVATKAVTNCVNNGSGLIRVTCTGHGWSTGEKVVVYNVGGTTEANSAWTITVIDANTFDLQGSTFTHAYTSGGSATNRPFLLGMYISLNLLATRGGITGAQANSEDANGLAIQNVGVAKGGAAIDINNTPNISGGGSGWLSAINLECNADWGISFTRGAAQTYAAGGIDFAGTGVQPVYGPGMIMRFTNGGAIYSRNAANNGDIILLRSNSNNRLEFDAPVEFADGIDIVVGGTTGTKISYFATGKLGFWGATPVVQQTASGNTHTVAAGATTSVFTNTTFDGSTGSTAYTIGDLVKILKTIGLIAA